MKNLIMLVFLILALVFAQFAQGQTVEEIINKHVEALGGKENWTGSRTGSWKATSITRVMISP